MVSLAPRLEQNVGRHPATNVVIAAGVWQLVSRDRDTRYQVPAKTLVDNPTECFEMRASLLLTRVLCGVVIAAPTVAAQGRQGGRPPVVDPGASMDITVRPVRNG